MLSRCNFIDIERIGTTGTIFFGNIAAMQINRNNDKFIFFEIILTDYNANIYN